MMHIHFHLRISLKDHFSKITVDFHGSLRIRFLAPSRLHFECFIFIRVHFPDICSNIFFQLFKSTIFQTYDRADTDDTKHPLQTLNGLFIVVISVAVYINSSIRFVYIKGTVHIFQRKPHLTYKCIFEQIPVLSFDSDLTVLYQK